MESNLKNETQTGAIGSDAVDKRLSRILWVIIGVSLFIHVLSLVVEVFFTDAHPIVAHAEHVVCSGFTVVVRTVSDFDPSVRG